MVLSPQLQILNRVHLYNLGVTLGSFAHELLLNFSPQLRVWLDLGRSEIQLITVLSKGVLPLIRVVHSQILAQELVRPLFDRILLKTFHSQIVLSVIASDSRICLKICL